jgi:peptidoglycan glycosyltransferase
MTKRTTMLRSEKKEKREKQDSTTKSKNSHKNREFVVIMYVFLAIFMGMMCYFVYFLSVSSEDFINSSYNGRQNLLSATVTRGEIRAAGGEVLAETITDSDGNETRNYPYGRLFAHVVGYSVKGKTGIESLANLSLLRSNVDFVQRAENEIQGEKSPGDSVITTLDVDIQQTAYDALRYYEGAVIVMEPSTGKILAMVSRPDYDPNNIEADWEIMTSEEHSSSELLNRATQGLYPPGSTFKIFTTLEYLHENSDDSSYSYTCNGKFSLGNETIHCHGNKVHGTLNLEESFAHSCNSSYAYLGTTLDIEQFGTLCDKLLFNTELPTKLAYSKSSFVLEEGDSTADIMQTAIGQGKTLVTPFHMALITSAIANDGVLMNPYVISSVVNADGDTVSSEKPSVYGRLLSESDAAILQEYMKAVVEEGTADELAGASYDVYGKTGSAEFSSNTSSCHSWFVGYAHREDKEDIAVAIIIEDSGLGSEFAVPVAQKIFDAYYNE